METSLALLPGIDYTSGEDADPYTALRQHSADNNTRRMRPEQTLTKSNELQVSDINVYSHMSFRSVGRSPVMPSTTPSLREQLYKLRMGPQQPLPKVGNAKTRAVKRRAAHNMDVKARMNKLLNAPSRGVIQKLRKENKHLSLQLKQSQDALRAREKEVMELKLALQKQHGGSHDDSSNYNKLKPINLYSNSASNSLAASSSSSRVETPKTPVSNVHMSNTPSSPSSRSNNSITSQRRNSKHLKRAMSNDFAGFRARSTFRGFRTAGMVEYPSQLLIKNPKPMTVLNLDEKTEDLLMMLQASGAVDMHALGLLSKFIELLLLLDDTSNFLDDVDSLCEHVGKRLAHITDCEIANVWLVNMELAVLECRTKNKKELMKTANTQHKKVSLTCGCVGQAYQSRNVVAIPDKLADCPLFDAAADSYRVNGGYSNAVNCLTVPLVGKNQEVIGVFQCLNRDGDGRYSEIEESLLKFVGRRLGLLIQRSQLNMKHNRNLDAAQIVSTATVKLYESLASISVVTDKQPDTFDMRRTLENLTQHFELYVSRLVDGSVRVRVHVAKQNSSGNGAEWLASLPSKRLQDTQDVVLNSSSNGLVGAAFQTATAHCCNDPDAAVKFNENIDISQCDGLDEMSIFTVPVLTAGLRTPLAVLQVAQPRVDTITRKIYMEYYENFATQVAFVLLYFATITVQGK